MCVRLKYTNRDNTINIKMGLIHIICGIYNDKIKEYYRAFAAPTNDKYSLVTLLILLAFSLTIMYRTIYTEYL